MAFWRRPAPDKGKLSPPISDHRHRKIRRDDAVWERLGVAGNTPARATVEATARFAPDYLVEIMVGRCGVSPGILHHLQRLPRRARGGIRSLVPGRASCRAPRRAGLSVRPPHRRIAGGAGLFQISIWSKTPRCSPQNLISNGSNNPTPMTRTIMSKVFINMNRRKAPLRIVRRGNCRGAFAVAARLNQTPDETALAGLLENFARHGGGRRRYGSRSMPPACRYPWKKNCAAGQEDCRRVDDGIALSGRMQSASGCSWPSNFPRPCRHFSHAVPKSGEAIYEGTIPLAQRVAQRLIARHETIAIAESSTGGPHRRDVPAVPAHGPIFSAARWAHQASRAALLGIGDAECRA